MRASSLTILGIVFVLLWSSGWIASSFVVSEISTIAVLTTRYLLVFGALLLYLLVTGQWRGLMSCNVPAHLFVGVLSHAAYLLAGVGAFELGVSAALVAFITALQPLLTAVMSVFITGERVSRRQWSGLLIGLMAVLLLVSEGYRGGTPSYALLLPFVAVITLSIGTLINRRVEMSNARTAQIPTPLGSVLFLQSTGALSLLIPMSVIHGKFHFQFNTIEWSVILWLALVVSIGAYTVLLLLLRHVSALRVSSLYYLIPPATMLQAYFFLGESISMIDITSMLIASCGVYIVLREPLTATGMNKSSPVAADAVEQSEVNIKHSNPSWRLSAVDIEL